MRHWVVESGDSPGGSLIYRRTVDMQSTTETLEMPDWFQHLAKNVTVSLNPHKHFGSGWGECQGNTVELHTTTLGQWHVLIMADRNDAAATSCPQEVEYIEQPPDISGDPPFPV